MADESYLRRLEEELLKKGLLIQSGFVGYRMAVGLADAGPVQIEETRRAFMAGAQHVFSCLMSILGEGEDPTFEDMRKIDMLDRELYDYLVEFCKRHNLDPPPPRR